MDIVDFTTAPVQRILAERAALLAQTAKDDAQELGEALVVFRLGESRYAVAAHAINAVHPLRGITRLPGVPPWIVGLTNVRSQLLSVLDLRPLLDLTPSPPASGAVVLALTVSGGEIALLADIVEDVRRSDPTLLSLVSQQTGKAVTWVRGLDQSRTIVIDAVGLAQDLRLIVDSDGGRSE